MKYVLNNGYGNNTLNHGENEHQSYKKVSTYYKKSAERLLVAFNIFISLTKANLAMKL